MKNIIDFHLSMIPNEGKTIFFENELLLADSIGVEVTHEDLVKMLPMPPFQIDFIMMVFCLGGELSFILNQQKVVLHANEVVLVSHNDIGEIVEINKHFEVFVIGFSNRNYFENVYSKSAWEFRNFLLFRKHFPIPEQDMKEYYMFYELMRNKLSDESFIPKKEFIAKSLTLMGVIMQNTIINASKLVPQNSKQRNILLLEQFINLVKLHFRKQHNLQFYADELCITPKYLSQLVYETSGHFASDWIKKYLIDEAKTLLKEGKYTANQVADALGFTNASYFTRFFKRETQMTPMQYQKE